MNQTNNNNYTKNAIAVINKPTGMNSLRCVKTVQRKLGAKKAGHLGTLDPLATGVLVVALNNATKLFEQHLGARKVYKAVFKFGVSTTTLDSEGEIEKREEVEVTAEQINNVLGEFVGEINQMPPAFSAKKIKGKKAYELARAGKKVELKPKKITIFNFNLITQIEKNTFLFEMDVSSGTYIRSLVRDLAEKLGTVGTMVALVRTSSGEYTLSQAVTIDEVAPQHLIEVD